MGTIFSSSPEKKLFLYSCGTSIYFRTAVNAEITRPIVLCNDFSASLSSTIFHDIIYYSYQNTDGDLILRNVLDTNVLFSLSSKESPGYFSPLLLPIDNDILFLFFIKNPLSEQYLLKYTHPLNPLYTMHDLHTFSALPAVHYLPFGNEILLSCHTQTESCLFSIESKNLFHAVELKSVNEEHAELEQKENMIRQKEEDIQIIKNEIIAREHELLEKDKIIESIKKQYEVLMNTAYQYREEAEKWYTRYYSRK